MNQQLRPSIKQRYDLWLALRLFGACNAILFSPFVHPVDDDDIFSFHLCEHTYTTKGATSFRLASFYVLVKLAWQVNFICEYHRRPSKEYRVFFSFLNFNAIFSRMYLFASFIIRIRILSFSLSLSFSLFSRVFLFWLTALPTGSHTLLRISVSFALFLSFIRIRTLSLHIDIHTQMYTYTFLSVTLQFTFTDNISVYVLVYQKKKNEHKYIFF